MLDGSMLLIQFVRVSRSLAVTIVTESIQLSKSAASGTIQMSYP